MPWRSSRNVKKVAVDDSTAEAENIDMEDVWEDDGDEDDTDAEESSDENDLDYGEQIKTPLKKRARTTQKKRAKTGVAHSSSSKNGRRKYFLHLLPTMPLDILYEIASHLFPKDILSLSRTSKFLHETLSSRNSISVWKGARERLDVPDGPFWMSEVGWSALLFENTCQSCGTANIRKVDFLLLKRICLSCKKRHYVLRSKVEKQYPGANFVILDLVPSTNVSAWSNWARSSYYYWNADLESTISKLAILEASGDAKKRIDFMEEQRRKIQCIRETSTSWRRWFEKMQEDRSQEAKDAGDRRLLQIKEKFKQLGYIEEDLLYLSTRKECREKSQLTDKIWNRLRPILEPGVLERKTLRLEQELATVKFNRREILASRYKDFIRTLPPSQWKYLPRILEIAALEPFARHIGVGVEVEVDASTFDDSFLELPRLLADATEQRRAALSTLIGGAAKEDGEIGVDPIDLATAVFRCSESHGYHYPFRYVFGWDEISSHHCLSETEGADRISRYRSESSSRTEPAAFEYSPEIAKVVQKLAQLLGLDAATATPTDFDKKDLRFSCECCSWITDKNRSYRRGYTWRHMAVHLENHNPSLKITILPADQANEVKLCERNDPKWTTHQWTCGHCSVYLDDLRTREVVLAHLSLLHGINNPSEPTDLFFFERYKKDWTTKPKYLIPEPDAEMLRKISNMNKAATKAATGKYRCLECPKISRLFVFNGVRDHLRAKHGVSVGQIGVHYAAA